jgi:outer membrane receptor protein involved in Fe transport
MFTKKPLRISLMLGVFSASLCASASGEGIEALLDDASEIATKSALNIDYMPSVVTVIDGDRFRDAGIQNVSEALAMLPGFQIQISPMGYTMVIVRGMKNPNAYLSDKIKIMVDGVTIHNEVSGSSNFYMDFPMQMVDRIEVLRGPGSTMYGAGSFYATINIITKTGAGYGSNRVQLGAGSYEYLTGGTNLHFHAGGWDLALDGYYQRNNKKIHSKQTSPWDQREGDSDEAMKDYSVGFLARNGGLTFQSRYKHNTSGNFYSFEGEFDPIPAHPGHHTNSYLFSQLSYEKEIGGGKMELKAGYSHREQDIRANISSIPGTAGRFAVVGVDMQKGFYYLQNIAEDNYEAEMIATLPEIYHNDLLVGAGARYVDITRDDFYSSVEQAIIDNYDTIVNSPNYDSFRYREERETAFWHDMGTASSLLKNAPNRTILYAYLQDLISVTEDVDVVLGLRLDDYSDFGNQWSKRAGVVYRADESLILKLLYGSAFRAPTLIEAYEGGHINFRAGDPSIKPESTDTYEFVAIVKPQPDIKILLNLFYSQLHNVIDLEEYPNTDPGYQNFDTRESRGIELEFFYKSAPRHDLYFNATVVDADYVIPPEEGEKAVKQSMPDISPVMLKAMYTYRPTTRASFSAIWQFYSETTATKLNWVNEDGLDPTVAPTHIIDVAMTYRFTPMSIMRFTVKNLFDADVRNPSYYYMSDGGVQREGMNFHVSLEQHF